MTRRWEEKLHPRRRDGEFIGKGGGDWASRLSGAIDGLAPAAPKVKPGYARKRPKDIKPGDVIVDARGKDRKVGSVVFHKVNVHSPNRTTAPSGRLLSSYEFKDDAGRTIETRHGLDAQGTSWIDTRDWAVKAGEQVRPIERSTIRPHEVKMGDRLLGLGGTYKTVARVAVLDGHYRFYDDRGNVIAAHHTLRQGDPTAGVISRFSNDTWIMAERGPGPGDSKIEDRVKRATGDVTGRDVTDDATFRRVRAMLGDNPTAVQLRAGAKEHDQAAKYYAKERGIFINGSGRVAEADRRRILAKSDADIAAHEAAAASLRARADALKKPSRAKKPAVTGPPPSPKVHPIGKPRDLIDDRVAQERMNRWRQDTREPGTQVLSETVRQREIRRLEAELIRQTAAVKSGATAARATLKRRSYPSPALYDQALTRYTTYNERQLAQTRSDLAALKAGDTPAGYHHLDVSTADALHLDPSYDRRARILAQEFDPARPLAIYGNMLHLEDMRHANGDTWHSYQAMDALEQKIPPIFHLHAAQHIAGSSDPNAAGIYIGRASVPEMDSLQDLRTKQPRGWHEGATWVEVDGVHRDATRTLAIGYTNNTEAHRSERMAHYAGRTSNPSLVDGTAALHEFGHLLDNTYGTMNPTTGEIERASKQRLFRLVHSKVVKYAGRRLNPYFKQAGDAGPQEFFAESFGEWARAGEGAWTFSNGDEVPGPGGKPLTKRTQHLANQFYLSNEIAAELDAYYTRLLKEVTTGKRKTARQLREGIR